MKDYVLVFQPRHYEFSEPEPPRIVYGPAPKDWCEQRKREAEWNGGPAGGSYSVREVTDVKVNFK